VGFKRNASNLTGNTFSSSLTVHHVSPTTGDNNDNNDNDGDDDFILYFVILLI